VSNQNVSALQKLQVPPLSVTIVFSAIDFVRVHFDKLFGKALATKVHIVKISANFENTSPERNIMKPSMVAQVCVLCESAEKLSRTGI
jgi:hypothetical protein